jgi:hypothetical protein
MAHRILAKIDSDGYLDMVSCSTEHGERMTELRESGFLDFVPSEQPQCATGYFAQDSFEIVDGKIVQSWEIKVDENYTKAMINDLKEQLSESDYKIIKCYESSLIGETLPYDIEALHNERQTIRDEINRLEAMIQ